VNFLIPFLSIFPLVYFASFFYSIKQILSKQHDGILFFFIFGLPIYITTLSVLTLYGLGDLIPIVQYTKEIIVLMTLGLLMYELKEYPSLTILDKIVLIYFFYTLIYIFIPLGGYSIFEKAIAFKNIAFFPFIYFIGRVIKPETIWLSKYKILICILAIATGTILLFEIGTYTHLQTISGYADYNFRFLGVEPTGNDGLTWTFEIEGGIKRFASFFANPLEHAAATLLTIAVLLALLSKKDGTNRNIILLTALAALVSVIFALSRASLAGILLVVYIYAIVTKRERILLAFHISMAIILIVILYFLTDHTLSEFIINTFNFSNSSSLSHLVEWVDGIESITSHPLGIGLGESGRIAGELGLNIGGENQLIILGVQTGIISIILYLAMLIISIRWSVKLFMKTTGKSKQLGILLFVFKVGMIIPMLTASIESYLYISYMGWFLTGLLSSIYQQLLIKKVYVVS
jgi:hypothetical protein